jgi:hypothetical protein
MRKAAAIVIAILALHGRSGAIRNAGEVVVLPSPELLRCAGPSCQQIWQAALSANAIYPRQVAIDFDHGCAYGLTAYYDASVSYDAIKSAIDDSYKQWAVPKLTLPNSALWRVEPMRFVIDLSIVDQKDTKLFHEEIGTKQVIYIAFTGRDACATTEK